VRAIRPLALASVMLAMGAGSLRAEPVATPPVAVAPQYDTVHVYVSAEDLDPFVASLLATFGGTATRKGQFTVTPTPSSTLSQLVTTPAGTFSVFGFKTPVPYPFGAERTGYLVTDLDTAIAAARADGADVIVQPFPDPIGRDAVIQWPGGVDMQLYWHTTAPNYPPLRTIPDHRIYVSPDRADAFIRAFLAFSHGQMVRDDRAAPGADIGRPGESFRRVDIGSPFGRIAVLVTDGHLPWPYGRELAGYDVADLAAVLDKAKAAGATVLVPAHAAMLRFPGGYIAEVHAAAGR
jgi:predicted enzyme related to lactoylglutathione lyase